MSATLSTFPTFVKFWKMARWVLLALALGYALLWMRYTTVERVLAFDPVVAMNAGFADVPVEDRGWPEMRKALVAMHADDPQAPELLREASRCEVLGFYAGHPEDFSPEDRELWPEKFSDEELSVDANPWSWERSAIAIQLPHLADFREAALYLKDHALEQGEGGSLEDLRAMRRLSVLCHEQPTLINQLVGMAILALEVDTMSHLLEDHGTTYSDEVLELFEVELDLALAALSPLSLQGEQIMFDDVLQRMYSDDGAGNGIFIGGSDALSDGMEFMGFPDRRRTTVDTVVAPFLAQWMPDRQTTRELYAAMMAEQVQFCKAPLWDRPEDSQFEGTGNPIIDLTLPALTKAIDQVQLKRMEIEAMSLVVAAYRERTRTGAFPAEAPIEVRDCWVDGLVGYEVVDGLPEVRSACPHQKGQVLFPVRGE